jgi:2,4-dienoyl-CoA reductase-like NADH-dependent reductase (Old Yellow Enzyme family)
MRRTAGSRFARIVRLGAAVRTWGLGVDEGIRVAKWLEEDGMPFLHVSTGIGRAPKLGPAGSPWSDRLLLKPCSGETR